MQLSFLRMYKNDKLMSDICEKCGGVKQNKFVMIVVGECRDCRKHFNIAVMVDGKERLLYGPDRFSGNELRVAEMSDVVIEERYSRIAKERCLVNVCTNKPCNSFVGESCLFKEQIQPAFEGLYKYKLIPSGTFCEQCDL